MIDLSKVRKGSVVKLKAGEAVRVTGLYLSGDGPVLMVKKDPSQTAAQNVPLGQVEEIVEEA